MQKDLTKQDYLIICGDFGGVWNNSNKDKYWCKWLSDKNYTTLFVDGNHENFDLLQQYPVQDFHGGKVHEIMPSVYHLMRGQVFNIDNFKVGDYLLHKIIHTLFKKKCIKEAQWKNQYLICPKCGSSIAIRYKMDNCTCVYVDERFKRYWCEVVKRKNENLVGQLDIAGDVDFTELESKELKEPVNELRGWASHIMTEPLVVDESDFEEGCENNGKY